MKKVLAALVLVSAFCAVSHARNLGVVAAINNSSGGGGGGGGGISLVSSSMGKKLMDGSGTLTMGFSTLPTASHLIVCGIFSNTAIGATVVTDNDGNTYRAAVNGGSAEANGIFYYITPSTASYGTYTVTASIGGGAYGGGTCAEFSGQAAEPLDVVTSASGISTTPNTGTTATTSATTQLSFIGMTEGCAANTPITEPGGYTSLAEEENGLAHHCGSIMYKISAALQSTTESAQWTITSNPWRASIATFKY